MIAALTPFTHQPNLARQRFLRLAARPDDEIDLAEGALLIAAESCASLDVDTWLERIDALADQAGARAPASCGLPERFAALVEFLFDTYGLKGNDEEYYDLRNSYLHEVLERRLGIPVTLALITIAVGRRIGIPIEGICFPVHFLMRLSSASHGFVDPFHPHKELWEPDLRAFLEKATGGRIPYEPRMLMPCSNKQILVRVLRNIKAMHVDRAEPAAAVSAIDRILTLSPTEAHERRERGILHFGLGHFRNAAEDLRAYLRTADRVHDRTYIEWKIEEAEAHLWEIN